MGLSLHLQGPPQGYDFPRWIELQSQDTSLRLLLRLLSNLWCLLQVPRRVLAVFPHLLGVSNMLHHLQFTVTTSIYININPSFLDLLLKDMAFLMVVCMVFLRSKVCLVWDSLRLL